jgi:hypothetical protein
LGCIVFKLAVGSRTTAAALIEGNNAIDGGIVETTRARITSSTGAAMYKQNRYAVNVTRLIDIQLMLVCDFYLVAFIGLEFGEEDLRG